MEIVKNEKKYWNFILDLRNDEKIKKGFISQEKIELNIHEQYMNEYGNHYYICLDNKEPVGFVGVVKDDIRFAVSEKHQGRGIGKFMIKFIKKKYPTATAKVKIDNKTSLKCFENNGYKVKYFLLELENEN